MAVAEFMSKKQLAERWGVSEKTVDRRRAEGDVEAVRIGGLVRITLGSVLACEERGREQPARAGTLAAPARDETREQRRREPQRGRRRRRAVHATPWTQAR